MFICVALTVLRYDIDGNDETAWEEAQRQVLKATKEGRANPVVSVKSSKTKRKAGPTAAEVYEEAFGEKKNKKAKKSKKNRN